MVEKILLVSCKPDPHLTSVVNLMNEQKIPFFRLNTEDLLLDYEFSWNCDNKSNESFYIKNVVNGSTIHSSEIKSVWCRRPEEPKSLLYDNNKDVNYHNLLEAKTFYRYLMYYLSDYYSIGNFFYDKYAASKFVQLSLATKLGMEIPETCFSNTKRDLVKIADKYDDLLIKPLYSGHIKVNEDYNYVLFATKINSDDLRRQPEESFAQTVNFCENYVPKKYELRVTVMGPHIFACKIDSQSQSEKEGKIDWRQGYGHNLKHELIELPSCVKDFCRKFLRKLHLNFGCFDFIVKPDDNYVFLECNPNGQWGWIEDELGIPMTEAIVDCLVNKLEV